MSKFFQRHQQAVDSPTNLESCAIRYYFKENSLNRRTPTYSTSFLHFCSVRIIVTDSPAERKWMARVSGRWSPEKNPIHQISQNLVSRCEVSLVRAMKQEKVLDQAVSASSHFSQIFHWGDYFDMCWTAAGCSYWNKTGFCWWRISDLMQDTDKKNESAGWRWKSDKINTCR